MSRAEQILSHEALRALLHYDRDTGIFTWLYRPTGLRMWNTRYAGKEAGYVWSPAASGKKYRCIRIFDWPFLGHRLAIFYETGKWPEGDVDHEDEDGLNNRLINLRDATKSQNGANRGVSKRNKVGLKGVTVDHNSGRYRATIGVNRKQIWLGYHDTPEAAHAAYKRAAEEHFGEFGRAK